MKVLNPKKSATRPTRATQPFGPSFPSFRSVPKSKRFEVFPISVHPRNQRSNRIDPPDYLPSPLADAQHVGQGLRPAPADSCRPDFPITTEDLQLIECSQIENGQVGDLALLLNGQRGRNADRIVTAGVQRVSAVSHIVKRTRAARSNKSVIIGANVRR